MLIDIFFLAFMIFAVFKGIQQGLIIALFSMVALVVGVAAAVKLSAMVAGHFRGTLHVSARWLPVLAFIVIFLLVSLVVIWAGRVLEMAVDLTLMGWLNKLGGIVFYVGLYCTVFSVLLFYALQLHLFPDSEVNSSVSYSYMEPWGPYVIEKLGRLIPVFKGMFTELGDFFDQLGRRTILDR